MAIKLLFSPTLHIRWCSFDTWDDQLGKVHQRRYDLQIEFCESLWQGFLRLSIPPSYEEVGYGQRIYKHGYTTLFGCEIVQLFQL
jgi:hypothetical protein